MILMMEREIADRRKWGTHEEFINFLSLAQASPGPMAVNTAILIGYKQKGAMGGICGFLGSVLPSFIILLTIAIFFQSLYQKEAVRAIFMGIRPAVVALILYPVFSFAKNVTKWEYLLFSLVGLAIYFGLSPVIFILGSIVVATAFTYYKLRKEAKK